MQFNNLRIIENKKYKFCMSSDYNFRFDKETGYFERWGKTKEDDPPYAPSPEILDLEISSGGMCKGNCDFCYKSNGGDQPTFNMTLEQFKIILEKVSTTPILSQIAFGIMNIDTNPDFFSMMEYAKEKGIIPNYTCHGLDITPEIAEKTANLCGAVAVSIVNKEKTYDSIKMFTDAVLNRKISVKKDGTDQYEEATLVERLNRSKLTEETKNEIVRKIFACNIHYMLSEETYDKAFEVVDDIANDPRLTKMNAIVFLQYKPKNTKCDYKSVLSVKKYRKLISKCESLGVRYGFDSCSANMFIKSIEGRKDEDYLTQMAEPCESGLFSAYINVFGEFFVCSFSEGIKEWKEGISVIDCNNFVNDIWNSSRLVEWRKKLLGSNRNCLMYNLSIKK